MGFEIPDACTLPTVERPLRLAEFDTLFATAVRGVEPVAADQVRMSLVGPVGLADTVRDLTARETECCSFFTFTITAHPTADGEALTLDIGVPATHTAVLASLAERAKTVSAGALDPDGSEAA
jgi:hypothetical protein